MIVCLLRLLKTVIRDFITPIQKLKLDTFEHVGLLNNSVIDPPVRCEFQTHSAPFLTSNLSRLLLQVQTKIKEPSTKTVTYYWSKLKFLSNLKKLFFEKKAKLLTMFNPFSANPTKWSQKQKQFASKSWSV